MISPEQITEARTAAQINGDSTRPRRRTRRHPAVAEAMEPPITTAAGLLAAVEEQDRAPETARLGGDVVHVSSLLDREFCPRKSWLARYEQRVIQRRAGGAMRVVWTMGRAAEHHIRIQLLKTMLHKAHGRWECDCRRSSAQGFFDAQASCPLCGSTLMHYAEQPLEFGNVTGSPDFIVANEAEELVVMEIKSIQKKDFQPLTAPVEIHVRQASFYVHLLHELGFRVQPVPIIFYVCKDFIVRESTYKSFDAPRLNLDNPSSEIRLAFADAAEATAEEIPNRLPACQSCTSVVAARCPFVGSCFARL